MEKTLKDWESIYRDDAEQQREIISTFKGLVNVTEWLLAHRAFVERHVYGFGERAFHWMWKLLIDEMPSSFRFLEVGVYKGQIISLVRLLANQSGRVAEITGVTPLSPTSGVTGKFTKFPDEDYMFHINKLHAEFSLQFDEAQIIKGDSTVPEIQNRARERGPFDVVFVDGCHEYDFVVKDLNVYGQMVKPGGYLVVDDSSNFKKTYWGEFWGIEDVSLAVRDCIEGKPEWKEVLAVMHDRVFRRVS